MTKSTAIKKPMKKLSLLGNSIQIVTLSLVASAHLLISTSVSAQQPDSMTLLVPYTKAQQFDVPRSNIAIKIDIEGFEMTYDSQPEDRVLFVAGNSKRRMVVKVTVDTLYTDLEKRPAEYRDLWWYFYTEDSTLDISKIKIWEENGRNWSTHTILTSNGFEINERHYDLFAIQDNYAFHVSIKRPLYLEGDSTLMMEILNSFEVVTTNTANSVAPDSTKSRSK